MTRIVVLAASMVWLVTVLAANPWVTKVVSEDWTWCEDYIYSYATYVVACEDNRECQIGMGVFALGRPLGEKIRFAGNREITVIGIGALHMRAIDGKGPVKVAFAQTKAEPIKTTPIPW